jgi:hypothetical protein
LLAIEGPNEPNNFPFTYNGQTCGKGATSWMLCAQFQSALYAAVKADANEQQMLAEGKQLALGRNDWLGPAGQFDVVDGVGLGCKIRLQFVDLDNFEPRRVVDRQFFLGRHHGELGDNQAELFAIPAGIERRAIVGEHIGALLRRGEAKDLDDEDLRHPEFFAGVGAGMSREEGEVLVNDGRRPKPEFFDQLFELTA